MKGELTRGGFFQSSKFICKLTFWMGVYLRGDLFKVGLFKSLAFSSEVEIKNDRIFPINYIKFKKDYFCNDLGFLRSSRTSIKPSSLGHGPRPKAETTIQTAIRCFDF